jgi:hypothetical protein
VYDVANNWPVLVGLRGVDGGPGHVYVLKGVRYSIAANGVMVFHRVELYDPWPGVETEEMTGEQFRQRLSFAIRMRVRHL